MGAVAIASRPADLIVASATVPATGQAGAQIRADWTIRNIGTGATPVSSWTDRIVAFTNAVLGDGDDVALASFTRTGSLGAGESYARSELVDIPFTLVGNLNLFIVTDAANAVFEGPNEGNNASPALPIAITRQTPDLQVTAVNDPAAGQAGANITIDWTVRNEGTNRTHSNYWYDAVYLSRGDAVLSGDDRLLGTVRRSNPLDPAGVYDATGTFTIPADFAGGIYYAIVRTDSTNLVLENPLENNNDRVSDPIALTPAPLGTILIPDLVLASVDAPLEAISGQGFSLTWTVRNDGDPTGNRPWYDAVYLSRDQVFDRNSDILNHIPESNESNNIGASLDRVDIDVELLQLSLASTGTLAQGQSMYYRLSLPYTFRERNARMC